ncbi:MAG: phosphotransacetylase family protein [Chloroflexi bacterium]|nr:phosphotransacetylase family protein [Chloroflexota bacterium]MCL5075027.1 phosphotransacetylase family protein [Chloroflexota bacterium]
MKALYVCSVEAAAGKTAYAIILARCWQRRGLVVGYMKPISVLSLKQPEVDSGDAFFAKSILHLQEPIEDIAPVELAPHVESSPPTLREKIIGAYTRIGQDKDIILLEAPPGLADGAALGLDLPYLTELFQARVLLILHYTHDYSDLVAAAGMARTMLGDNLIGVVINAIPERQVAAVRGALAPSLEREGIRILGTVKQDNTLFAPSVADLVRQVNGEVLCGADRLDRLAEHIMIGAMSPDGALAYFQRLPNKAVIVPGDRPDIQLAALRTPTCCLILTGDFVVNRAVLILAEESDIPLVRVKEDIITTLENLEGAYLRTRFRQESKIQRLETLLAEEFDLTTLGLAIGLGQ